MSELRVEKKGGNGSYVCARAKSGRELLWRQNWGIFVGISTGSCGRTLLSASWKGEGEKFKCLCTELAANAGYWSIAGQEERVVVSDPVTRGAFASAIFVVDGPSIARA